MCESPNIKLTRLPCGSSLTIEARTRRLVAMKIHALHREENIAPQSQLPKSRLRSSAKKLSKYWSQKNCNRRVDKATSWRQRNLRIRWHVRQYKDGDARMSRTASVDSAPTANRLPWFYRASDTRQMCQTMCHSYAASSEPMKPMTMIKIIFNTTAHLLIWYCNYLIIKYHF